MVPLLQVQLVQALAFQESPASSTSPSLVMQYSCWLLFTGSKGLWVSSGDAHGDSRGEKGGRAARSSPRVLTMLTMSSCAE